MEAGFYTTDITPYIGMEKPGGYGKSYITSIHDRLKARAAVVSDGKEKAAIVGIDSLVIQSFKATARIRSEIKKRTGIKESSIMIAASHTHMGGPFFGLMEDDYTSAPPLIKKLVSEYSTIPDPVYYEYLIGQIVTAVCEADRRLTPATLSGGKGFEGSVVFNRRFRMKNGRTFTHPGKGNREIISPAGPIDPEVGVISAWDSKDNLLGCIVNYACHGTTFNGGVSADWIYYLDKTISDAMGNSVVVFLNGACGDVTQVNNLSKGEAEFGEKWADIVGASVGAEAINAPVAFKTSTVRLKRRKPSQERVTESLKIVENGLRTMRTSRFETEWIFAKELLIANYLCEKEPEVTVEIQGIQIGPAVFLANPSEFFCQLGIDIKKRSRFPLTFVVELANDCIGYVPDEGAFKPEGGGYETVLTGYSNMEITAGSKIVETSLKIAEGFKPGLLPETEKIDVPRPPWGYGVLGPDLK